MSRKFKILLVLSITFNIVLVLALGLLIFKFKLEIKAKMDSKTTHEIVMFGDSQIFNANWSDQLKRGDVYNAGMPGFTTSHFVWLVNEKVLRRNPRICFIEAGTNDIGVGIPLARTFSNFRSIVDTLLAHKIETVLQSTLYTNNEGDSVNNLQVDTLNTFLKDLAKQKKIDYIDLNSILSSDRKLIKSLTYDGTHLNDEGYKLWTPKIVAVLKRKNL